MERRKHVPEGGVAEELNTDRHEQQRRRREDRLPDAEAEAAGAADGARASARPVPVIHPRRRRTITPFPYARARHTRPDSPLASSPGRRGSRLLFTSARGAVQCSVAGMLERIWRAGRKAGDGIESPGALRWMETGHRYRTCSLQERRGDSFFSAKCFLSARHGYCF